MTEDNARFWVWHRGGWVKLTLAPGQSLTSAALELAEAPCGPIAMESPNRATMNLFASPHLDSGLIQFPWKPVGR